MAIPSPANAATARPLLIRCDAHGITTLTLNRPQQFNALSGALLRELQTALDDIEANDSVRVVVLAGSGDAFCAGHDLKEMRAHRDREYIHDLFTRCSRIMLTIMRLPQPVIARVHGIATAAGCQLVAACDLAIAASDARFATSGINYGLFCATPSVPLTRNVPRKQAFEMLFTGDISDAATALARGLVNRVVPREQLDSGIAALAHSILGKPASVVAAGKRLFYAQIEMELTQAYRLASQAITDNLLGDDAAEGIDAFLQKRTRRWSET
ncbi:MAG: enoyl-CoA hydratase [Pseudomonadota bacterium]|nr:enoyl-CoA hydratase [Pseudomonadota bacterium]